MLRHSVLVPERLFDDPFFLFQRGSQSKGRVLALRSRGVGLSRSNRIDRYAQCDRSAVELGTEIMHNRTTGQTHAAGVFKLTRQNASQTTQPSPGQTSVAILESAD